MAPTLGRELPLCADTTPPPCHGGDTGIEGLTSPIRPNPLLFWSPSSRYRMPAPDSTDSLPDTLPFTVRTRVDEPSASSLGDATQVLPAYTVPASGPRFLVTPVDPLCSGIPAVPPDWPILPVTAEGLVRHSMVGCTFAC